jgi:hypothetical protein
MTKLLVAALVILLPIMVAGCFMEDLTPCKRSPGANKWVDKNTKKTSSYTFLGTVKDEKEELDTVYIGRQNKLQAELDTNKKVYEVFANSMNTNIKEAHDLFTLIVGTPTNPGYGWTLVGSLLAGLGVNLYKNNTMYSEAEYQAKA